MTLAARRACGFTLLEILIAVAIVGLLTASLVGVSMNVVGDRPRTPAEFFWTAVDKAIDTALTRGEAVEMSFDREKSQFVLRPVAALAAAAAHADPMGAPEDDDEAAVPGEATVPVESALAPTYQFLRAGGSGMRSTVLIGGRLVETTEVKRVVFYPDGTCTPFRVQILVQGNEATTIDLDPWTCAPVLPADAGK